MTQPAPRHPAAACPTSSPRPEAPAGGPVIPLPARPPRGSEQRNIPREKRLFSWWTDDYGVFVSADGSWRKVPANHVRGRYYDPMARKRNYGRKPRTRLRRVRQEIAA